MASWEDVARLALALPETTDGSSRGNRTWEVRGKGFAWERPLRKNERKALGADAPDESVPILGVHVEHLLAKEALLQGEHAYAFTTPHFDGYPAVLILLEEIGEADLEELLTEAWLTRAPKRLAEAFLEDRT